VFPIYYESITKSKEFGDLVSFFGFNVPNTVLYSYALSFSFLFVALILPLLTGIADYSGKKKRFMQFFAYLGATACAALYFFDSPDRIEIAILCSIVASIGYSGSLVFYNSFLPEIVDESQFDKVSARGFSYGYFGSVLLLILNLAMIQMPDVFGLEGPGIASRVSFLLVGVWWIAFAQYSFAFLPDNIYRRRPEGNIFLKGYIELKKVWSSLSYLPDLKKFLLSFFFYSIGVQTIMYLAPLFGSKELKLETSALILTVLIIQIVAIAGSFLFAKVSEKYGNKVSLVIMVNIWIGVCIGAFFVNDINSFFLLAFVVGMIMGGIQALSRATYSKLIPKDTIDHASFFSFFDVTYNLSIVIGTFAYGVIEHLTGSMRNSTLALGIFFAIGLFLLLKVKIQTK
jgi:UMF1 family MFS transporter